MKAFLGILVTVLPAFTLSAHAGTPRARRHVVHQVNPYVTAWQSNQARLLYNYNRAILQSQYLAARGLTPRVVVGHVDVELRGGDDMQVRLAQPAPQYDDKGNFKKLTAEDLKQLKGPDPKLPGYTGDESDLRAGDTVEVRLTREKKAPSAGASDPDKNLLDQPDKTERVAAGTLVGRLVKSENSTRRFTLRVFTPKVQVGGLTLQAGKGAVDAQGLQVSSIVILANPAAGK